MNVVYFLAGCVAVAICSFIAHFVGVVILNLLKVDDIKNEIVHYVVTIILGWGAMIAFFWVLFKLSH